MPKEVLCRDIGPDCDAVVVAETEDEILAQVAEHARRVHGMTEEQITDPAFLEHARAQIHDRA